MIKIIEERDGRYRLKKKITIKDVLLVLSIVCLVLTIALLFEV